MSDTAKRTEPIHYADHPDLPKADHIPDFATEQEMRDFFDTHDVSLMLDQLEEVSLESLLEADAGPDGDGASVRGLRKRRSG